MLLLIVTFKVLSLVSPSFGGLRAKLNNALRIKPIETLVEERGYPIEKHVIGTEDGFQLMYHRVPHGRHGNKEVQGHPVLLAHGVLSSSSLYLAMDNGLPYQLADAGFDVWLVNVRGNTFSRSHKNYSPSDKEFWDFSFHEVGKFDLPAAIDFILAATHQPTLSYVGFSMGTTIFWVLADSWGPKYMAKVDTMVAIAPVARPSTIGFFHSTLKKTGLKTLLGVYKLFRSREVWTFSPTEAMVIRKLCSKGESKGYCRKLISTLVGSDPESINYDDAFRSTQYIPAGTSSKNLRHFMQVGEKASFQQFDYGEEVNLEKYKSSSPPKYDLKKVTCPVFLVRSDKDTLSVKQDVDWLASQLPTKPEDLFTNTVQNFDHLSFFYSKNVKRTFYEPLVGFLKERTQKYEEYSTNAIK